MLTAEDLLNRSARLVDPSTTQPQIVYVSAARPTSRRWFMGFLLIAPVAAIAWGISSGEIGISQEGIAALPHVTVAAVATKAPALIVPTANAAPIAVVAPAAAPVVVIPQGQYHAEPTSAPPTAAPPPISAEVEAVYTSIIAGPDSLTPIPVAACEAGKETYVTSAVRVLNPKGMPIGEAHGRSCVSDQEAHDNANRNAQEVADKDKAAHPENWT